MATFDENMDRAKRDAAKLVDDLKAAIKEATSSSHQVDIQPLLDDAKRAVETFTKEVADIIDRFRHGKA
jgi:hypothetical protein